MKDYYRILGISRSATAEEIKAAYLRLAKKFHPDVNADCAEWAAGMFKECGEAYAVLSEPEKRRRYDFMISGQAGPRVVPIIRRAAPQDLHNELQAAMAQMLLALMSQSRAVVENPTFMERLAEKVGLVKKKRNRRAS